jgi:hypothetical protein
MVSNIVGKALNIIKPSESPAKGETTQPSPVCNMEAWTNVAHFLLTMIKRIFQIDNGTPASRGTSETIGGMMYFGVNLIKRLLAIDGP